MCHSRQVVKTVACMLLVLVFAVVCAMPAHADPPGRVAYLSDFRGELSYSPAGEDDWIDVIPNRPLIQGDRLWADRNSRAELQVGNSAIRLGSNTGIEILNLDDRIAQLYMTEGALSIHVQRLRDEQVIEVDTPMLAFTIRRPGSYRIDVEPSDALTTLVVWEGAGEAYGLDSSFSLRQGDAVRFYDANLRDYEIYGLPEQDALDRYANERDYRLQRSASRRYVGDGVLGYEMLDTYGSWRSVRGHGSVWFPSSIEVGWAPYRNGFWVWQEPWGWTWVDYAPWGFAPFHYGRWVYVRNRWGWVPGPRGVAPVYAPALVAFVGGSNWSLSLSLGSSYAPVGWFPLGPREVYLPPYRVSREYFTRVNVNNTVINNTTITHVYNNYSTNSINDNQIEYANRNLSNAVTAVPAEVFVASQPVKSAAIRVDSESMGNAEITRVAPVAPTTRSVMGDSHPARIRPPRATFNRKVIAHNTPPSGIPPLNSRSSELNKNPGHVPELQGNQSRYAGNSKRAKNVQVPDPGQQVTDARAAGSPRAGESDKPQQLKRSEEQQDSAKQEPVRSRKDAGRPNKPINGKDKDKGQGKNKGQGKDKGKDEDLSGMPPV